MATILIVDDNPKTVRVLERIIGNAGHEAIGVPGGREAIEQFTNRRFDLAFVDLMMPGMSGVELMAWMWKEAPDTRIVPMSAVSELLRAPREMMRETCLTKPFRLDDVLDLLKQVGEVSQDVDSEGGKPTY